MAHGFSGGIHPSDGKKLSENLSIEVLPPAETVVIPMSQHIGAPCTPLVKKGDLVRFGQMIGSSQAAVSAPVHASVSGTVTAVEARMHPNGKSVLSVVIANDGLDTPDEGIRPLTEAELAQPEAVIARIRESGIVGMGGAAFPTHFKISSGMNKVDTVLINAAECEPYITADYRILLEETENVIKGVKLLCGVFGLDKATIVIEDNKPAAVKALRAALSKLGETGIELLVQKTRYPQGAEKQLIQSATGRQVPPGGLPADVKCVVFNVYSCWSVYRAVYVGVPAIDRVVTVSGPAIASPKNLRVRVGTPIQALIDAAGGFKEPPRKLLMGGPMMGNAQFDTSVPVIKGTNALTCLTKAQDAVSPDPTCIRCGKCVGVCPMHLQPVYLYMFQKKGLTDRLAEYNLTDCMECGACTYICPGRLPLTQAFRAGKAALNAEKARLAAKK